MDSRSVLIVLLRTVALILGLWVLLFEILWLPHALGTHSANLPGFVAVGLATSLLVVLVWAFATRLAALLLPMTRTTSVAAPSTVEEFTRAAFCVLGIWYIVETFSSIPYFMLFGFAVERGKDSAPSLIFILAPAFNLVAGLALLAFASRLAKRICVVAGTSS